MAFPCVVCSLKWHGPVLQGDGTCPACLRNRFYGVVGESRDNDRSGSGDHDIPFVFGHPGDWLTTIQEGLLLVMRGYVLDTRRGVKGLAADGDLEDP